MSAPFISFKGDTLDTCLHGLTRTTQRHCARLRADEVEKTSRLPEGKVVRIISIDGARPCAVALDERGTMQSLSVKVAKKSRCWRSTKFSAPSSPHLRSWTTRRPGLTNFLKLSTLLPATAAMGKVGCRLTLEPAAHHVDRPAKGTALRRRRRLAPGSSGCLSVAP